MLLVSVSAFGSGFLYQTSASLGTLVPIISILLCNKVRKQLKRLLEINEKDHSWTNINRT